MTSCGLILPHPPSPALPTEGRGKASPIRDVIVMPFLRSTKLSASRPGRIAQKTEPVTWTL